MLKKFTVKNYKNFKDEISIDFESTAKYQFNTDCISHGLINKMLIYGKNATGKTNLGRALFDICYSMFSMFRPFDTEVFLNADSKEEAASFFYEFKFGKDNLIYRYAKFSNQEFKNEELLINGITVFSFNFEKKNFDSYNPEYIKTETVNTERFKQAANIGTEGRFQPYTVSFLRWLINNVGLSDDSVLIKLADYVRSMYFIRVGEIIKRIPFSRMNNIFYEQLEDSARLKSLENFLNDMGIECTLELQNLPDGQKELYFKHEKLVPFYETASSGTLALVNLYKRLIPMNVIPSFIYLDEFDAFYHYEMSEKVIKFFKKAYPDCQIVMTSHNTNLMSNQLMRPDCLFILSKKGTLTALCDATKRELREGHNLEKMYISGEFDNYE